ncbi:MAG: hypothetical protein Q7J07_03640 [Pelolinea sp.]|nr:hypothetical protein [Pelolinea sp.]
MMLIRAETEKDRETVFAIYLLAFDTSAEANLVDARSHQLPAVVCVCGSVRHRDHFKYHFSLTSKDQKFSLF